MPWKNILKTSLAIRLTKTFQSDFKYKAYMPEYNEKQHGGYPL